MEPDNSSEISIPQLHISSQPRLLWDLMLQAQKVDPIPSCLLEVPENAYTEGYRTTCSNPMSSSGTARRGR